MKKLTIFAALCALLLGSCAENNLDGVTPENTITLPDLTAGFAENETKTYVHNNTYLRWHEADLITAFYGNSLNRQYKFKGKTGDNSGTFSLIPSGELGTGNDLGAIYAVYPYDENAGINDETRVISLTLPATQTYAENSFGKGANTMIAVTENIEDTFLGFKNACGYLKLKLYGEDVTLASVEVRGNNGEKIAGSATATMEFGGVPALTMSADATTTVTLDCGEGVVLGTSAETATELWIVLPETTFEGGITITATDTEGITFEKSTTNPVAIVRNEIQPMAALNAEFMAPAPTIPNNEIWYTATEKVTPYATDVFGANIVSNEWDETTGEGVITFDREVASIGWNAFYSCSKLTSIIIPEGVISIGHGAFANCFSLTSITIPNSVTSVAYNAFNGCSSLPVENNIKYAGTYIVEVTEKTQTTYTIKKGTKFIGPEAFYNCQNLTNIVIPDSVISIGYYAFAWCPNLTNIIIPNSVTSLGESAFADCSRIECLTIGNGITRIEPTTFYGCSSLASVIIPDSVTEIRHNAFDGCSSLAEVYCKPTTPPSGDEYMFSSNALGRKIYVPAESLEAYKTATYWSNYADDIIAYDFEKGEVVVPIPKPANNEIWYTATEKVTPYSTYVFGANIVSNEWNSLTLEGVITFDGEVTKIGDSAFYQRFSLVSITTPDSITSIGQSAFRDCSNLTSISLPSVEDIYAAAFYGCSSLANVTFPSLIEIHPGAFQSCESLTSVTIPESVTSILASAFDGTGLVSVYCKPATPPAAIPPSGWNAFPFNYYGTAVTIYVPTNSVEAYKTADGWREYADAIVGYDF